MRGLVLLCAVVACGKMIDEKPPEAVGVLPQLEEKFAVIKAEAEGLRDPATKWLARWDCDGMIWAAKYAIAIPEVDILAAEVEPGLWSRRPLPWCWTTETGDQGSKTTWSRDMAMAGLIPWALLRGRGDALMRHASYGSTHDWVMGQPLENRVVYTPQLIGLLYRVIHHLGGPLDERAIVPQIHFSGLKDFELHLQMNGIWIESMISSDAVSQRGLDLIREATETEPRDPFYRLVLGTFTGDLLPAVHLLLEDGEPQGAYVRCSVPRECQIASWLFVAHLVIERLKAQG